MDLKTWFVTEDRGTDPDVLEGRVTDYLSQAMLKRAEYYICGSQPMRRAVESLLAAQGVGSEAIVTDRF
jgi:ferredoxin-NADP reductase